MFAWLYSLIGLMFVWKLLTDNKFEKFKILIAAIVFKYYEIKEKTPDIGICWKSTLYRLRGNLYLDAYPGIYRVKVNYDTFEISCKNFITRSVIVKKFCHAPRKATVEMEVDGKKMPFPYHKITNGRSGDKVLITSKSGLETYVDAGTLVEFIKEHKP